MIWLVIFIMVGQCHCCRNLSCVSVSSTVKCHEDAQCLLLHWSEMIPYAYLKDGETSPQGILIGIAKRLLDHCCDSCWQIQETLPVNFTDFYYKKPELAGLSLPYIMSAADYHYLTNYVPVIKDPTSAFVKKKDGWKTLYKNLMATIRDGWSVLVIILVFSWISGMIIWLMEMWFNDEQFPRKFLRGSWEGFWWAFVSMTTVGYGDRAPRTLLGRVFAIFWILIGICICSIFTATLASSLTMNSFAHQNTITRTKVGVMINSMEAITAIQNQADVIYYNSLDELFDAVRNDEVEGILFDYYFALVHEKDLTSDDLIIANIFEPKDWSLGFKLLSKELAECMREEYYHNYAEIFYKAVLNESIPEPSKIVSESQLSGIFDPDGVLFAMILYFCAGGALCMFIAGLCWDLLCQGKKIGPKSEKVKKLENMEKELMAELQVFFMSWKERMASTKEASNRLDTLESKA